jgi:hypothetical protein
MGGVWITDRLAFANVVQLPRDNKMWSAMCCGHVFKSATHTHLLGIGVKMDFRKVGAKF